MSQISLPIDSVQRVHDYLLTRPMGEVEQLVAALRAGKPLPPEPEPAPECPPSPPA